MCLPQSSADISNYNITSFIHKLTTGEEYAPFGNASSKQPKVGQRSSQSQQFGYTNQEVIIEEVASEESHASQEEDSGKGEAECESSDKGVVELSKHSSSSKTTSTLRGPLFNGEYELQDSIAK